MMKKITSLVVGCVLSVSIMVGCSGSGGETIQSTNSKVPDEPQMPTYSTTETFRIGNWGVPPHANTGYMEYANNPDYCTEENWTTMRDCGFNLAIPTGGTSVDEILKDLEMAEKVGMSVLVRDRTANGLEGIITLAGSQGYDYDKTKEEIEKRETAIKGNIDRFKEYDSFIGINAYDEPSVDYYEAIAACQDWFLKNYPEYEFYCNLLPVYATPKQLFGTQDGKGYIYSDYVSMFSKEVNPACLSYDHYPILQDYDESAYIKEDFLYNLNIFAKQAKKNKVHVNIYLQTMGFFNNLPLSSYEEFAWQCYTSLAFGVKGINCFQYWTQLQAEYHNNVRGGIVDRDGTITPLYYHVQKVFNNIKAMQDVYLSYKWDGVKTYEGGRIVNDMFALVDGQLDKLAVASKVDCDKDIIVGQFVDSNNKYAYMITNASSPFYPEEANVEVKFDNYYYVLVVTPEGRNIVKLDNHILNMSVKSGEGNFVVPLV